MTNGDLKSLVAGVAALIASRGLKAADILSAAAKMYAAEVKNPGEGIYHGAVAEALVGVGISLWGCVYREFGDSGCGVSGVLGDKVGDEAFAACFETAVAAGKNGLNAFIGDNGGDPVMKVLLEAVADQNGDELDFDARDGVVIVNTAGDFDAAVAALLAR